MKSEMEQKPWDVEAANGLTLIFLGAKVELRVDDG